MRLLRCFIPEPESELRNSQNGQDIVTVKAKSRFNRPTVRLRNETVVTASKIQNQKFKVEVAGSSHSCSKKTWEDFEVPIRLKHFSVCEKIMDWFVAGVI